MASRENQGLQIALIIFVMITVALGVTTYVFYDQSVKAAHTEKSAKEQAKQLGDQVKALRSELDLLKSLVGSKDLADADIKNLKADLQAADATAFADFEKIENEYNNDMRLFKRSGGAEGWAGAQNWSTLPDYLVQVILEKNTSWKDELVRADTAVQQRDTQVAAEKARADKAKQDYDAAITDYQTAKTDFDAYRTDITTQKDQLQTRVNDAQVKITETVEKSQQQIAEVRKEANTLSQLVEGYKERAKSLQSKEYDVPDGKVKWVDHSGRKVLIDLGIADGLRRSQTFSVYDKTETNHSKATPKASIEVTRLMESHLAEARILDDDVGNPILPNDFIYTPAWVPGRKVHFALAGFMDIDEDDVSDRELIKNVIRLNAGVVDAEVTDAGERVNYGEGLTVHTRWLVIGDRPTEKSDAKALQQFSFILDEAKDLGVEVISIQRVLSFMGYKGEITTSRGRGSKTKSKAPAAGLRGSTYTK